MSDPVRLRADRRNTDHVVLSVSGEVDLVTGPGLEQAITAHLGDAHHVVLDLTAVTFFGSFGLATLVKTNEVATNRGVELALVPNRLVRRTMDLTSTAALFTVYDTVAAALAG